MTYWPADVRVMGNELDMGAYETFVPELELTISVDSVFETAGSGAVTATVTRNTDTASMLKVTLASSDTSEARVPPNVKIPAGQSSVTFSIDIVDDAIADGPQTVTITASATGHGDGTDTLEVYDDEAQLTLVIAADAISEAAGAAATTATVSRNTGTAGDLVVTLASGDTSEATVPATVTILNGFSSATFDVGAVDDPVDDDTQTVTITAAAAGYADGSDTLDVTDDDTAGVTVAPAAGLVTTERGGQATFTIVLTSEPTDDVTIDLTSSDTTEGTVSPTTVTFTPADWDTPQTVTVTGVDDPDVDGDVAYTIVTAAAASADPNYNGMDPADVSVTNQDNDLGGEIRGSKWHDLDGDGVHDAGEPGLEGWTVFLDANGNDYLDVGELSTTTGPDGSYEFLDLLPGTYTVVEVPKPGWYQTGPAVSLSETALSIPIDANDLVFDPHRNILYGTGSGVVYRYDLTSRTTLAPLAIGSQTIYGADITPDGQYLYLAGGVDATHQISKVHLDSGVVTAIPYSPGYLEAGPYDVAVTSGGYALFTTRFSGSGRVLLKKVSLADDSSITSIRFVRQDTRVARSADYDLCYFAEANSSSGPTFTYSAFSGSLLATRNMGMSLTGAALAANRNGTLVSIDTGSVQIYDETLQPVQSNFGNSGWDGGIAFDPVRDVFYVVDDDLERIVAYDTNTWTELYRRSGFSDGGISAYVNWQSGVFAFSDDGRFLFISDATHVDAFRLFGRRTVTLAGDDVSGVDFANARNAFRVADALPAAGALLGAGQLEVRYRLGEDVDPATVDPADVTFGGVPATSVSISGDNKLTFQFTGVPDGTQTVALAAGSILSIAGEPIEGFSYQVDVDTTPPTVTVDPLSTFDSRPPLSGSVDDPAAAVEVTVNGSSYTATNHGDGTWTLPDNRVAALPAGTYDVQVTATDAAGNAGSDATTGELTIYPPTEIRGTVWNDYDGDGARDADEPGLGGRVVFLDADGDGLRDPGERTATTTGSGSYVFNELLSGTYTVAAEPLTDWRQTYPAGPPHHAVSLVLGDVITGVDFGSEIITPQVVSITRLDANPTALDSVSYQVTFNKAVAGVDASDFSLFADGPVGAAVFGVTGDRALYTVSVATGTGDGTLRLDLVDDNSIVDASLSPLGGAAAGDGDFTGDAYTVVKSVTIQGTKWRDVDGDGVRDAGDAGIPGWLIYLDANGNGRLDLGETWTETDAGGNYSFSGLAPGTYAVTEVRRSGWIATSPSTGSSLVAGAPGQTITNVTFGNCDVGFPTQFVSTSLDGYGMDAELDGTFAELDTLGETILARYYNPPAGVGEERGLLEFDVAPVGASATVVSAALELSVSMVWDGPVTLDVYGYAGDGVLTSADPLETGTLVGTLAVSAAGPQRVTIDPAFIQSRVTAAGYAGFVVKVASGGGVAFHSSDSLSVAPASFPTLVIDTAPTGAALVVTSGGPIAENAGPAAGVATLTRYNMDNSTPLTVTLSSRDSTEVTVPATVTIPAGQASVTFPLDAVDDLISDGTQTVAIDAVTRYATTLTVTQTKTPNFLAKSVAVQPDGRIVVVGAYRLGTSPNYWATGVARYLANGLPDTTFGGSGSIVLDLSELNDQGEAVAVQPDGAIVVASSAYFDFDSYQHFALARLLPDGTLDPAFGDGGLVVGPPGAVYDLAIQPDGKIVGGGGYDGGLAAFRFLPDGAVDTAFGEEGIAQAVFSSQGGVAYGIALQDDGKIVVAGTSAAGYFGSQLAVARFTSGGQLDTTFSSDGKATGVLPGTYDYGRDVVIQPDGKIVVVGQTRLTTDDFAVVRFLANGSLDTSFGTGGVVTTDLASGTDRAYGVALQADGKIIVTGIRSDWLAVLRYSTGGALETYSTSSISAYGAAAAIHPGGQILVAGPRSGGTYTGYLEFRGAVTTRTGTGFVEVADNEPAQSGAVAGKAWNDLDGDGAPDPGEPPLEGWTVYVDFDQNGLFDGVDVAATTRADGSYLIAQLPAGTYTIAEVPVPGWEQTHPAGGAGQAATVVAGTVTENVDFGNRDVPPLVTSIRPADPNPTGAATVNFTVTFTEPVQGVDALDFQIVAGGSVSGASLVGISPGGTALSTTYTVTVGTGGGDGTLGLNLLDDDSIEDVSGNRLGGDGGGNGNFTGDAYTIDKTAPAVQSITAADANPTTAALVHFTVVFSEEVTGLDPSDFNLLTTGTIAGAHLSGITGAGATYSVAVATGMGSGTIRLDLGDDDTITDAAGNPLGGPGLGNGDFALGDVYTIENVPPTAVADAYEVIENSTLTVPAPTAAADLVLHYTFDEATSGSELAFDRGSTPAAPGRFMGDAARVANTPGGASAAALDLASGGARFDYVTAGDADKVDALTQMTVTLWLNLRGDPRMDDRLVSGRHGSGDPDSASSWEFGFSDTTLSHSAGSFALQFEVASGSRSQSQTISGFSADHEWIFLALSFSSAMQMKLYEGDETTAVALRTTSNFAYSIGGGNASELWIGAAPEKRFLDRTPPAWIDDVRIYGRVLDAAEIDGVRREGLGLPMPGVLANDADPDGERITAALDAPPANGSLSLASDGSFTYTPDPGFYGTDSFTYWAGDGMAASGPVTVTIEVLPTHGEIHGSLWNDADGNGVRDAGETPLPDWTVYLDLDQDGVQDAGEPAAVTAGDGSYGFTGLLGGTYWVTEVVQPTWQVTHPDSSGRAVLTIAGDQTISGVDFGNYNATPAVLSIARADPSPASTGSVNFTVTFSENVSGVDPGDFALITSGSIVDASIAPVTGSGSVYTVTVYTGLGDGTIGLNLVDDDSIIDLTGIPLGAAGTGNGDFTGEVYTIDKPGTVRGVKWNDLDQDGVREAGEPGLPGWTIFWDRNTNGVYDPGGWEFEPDDYAAGTQINTIDPRLIFTQAGGGNYPKTLVTAAASRRATTGENVFGNYYATTWSAIRVLRIDFLAPVTSVSIDAIAAGSRSQGILEAYNASGTLLATYTTAPLYATGFGQRWETMTVARTAPEIAYVIAKSGEIAVELDHLVVDADVGDVAAKTNADGVYRFSNVADGSQTFGEVPQAGWEQSYPGAAGMHAVMVNGDLADGVDFGNYQLPPEISGAKWNDLDGDGRWDAGEPALSGWIIYLDQNRNGQLDDGETWTTTGAGGKYLFPALLPGTYTVAEVQQAGWRQTWPSSPGDTTLEIVSVDGGGNQANAHSDTAAISADGRYVAFISNATNLVPQDTDQIADVYVYDRQTGTVELVSVSTGGEKANASCDQPAISGDGRYVAFRSSAGNLVANDLNQTHDIFVHDRQTGATVCASVDPQGNPANGQSRSTNISADGRYVGYWSEATNLVPQDTGAGADVYVYDIQTGAVELVSVSSIEIKGNRVSYGPSLSADGRYVAFQSQSTNLHPNDSDTIQDIYVRDRLAGTTELVSVDSNGVKGNAASLKRWISGDGRYVAFESNATNLVADDANGNRDVFVHDRQTGETRRVSVASDGSEALGGPSGTPAISADGRYVVFVSSATNLVPGDVNGYEDAFVHDLQTGVTRRVSVAPDGSGVNDGLGIGYPAISSDGHCVAFDSRASNLVAGDANGYRDVFVAEMQGPGVPISHRTIVGPGQIANQINFGNHQDPLPATIVDRRVFYNDSYFDGDAGPSASDDNAVAPSPSELSAAGKDPWLGKTALLSGQTGSFQNYISYAKGLNGIMIDVANLANPAAIDAGDFIFKYGNTQDPSAWLVANPPKSVTVREGAGSGDSDRITLIWDNLGSSTPNESIPNTRWLQVTVLANDDTGLATADVFYFGLAVGESGDSTTNTYVNALDRSAARNNPHTFLNRAPLEDACDFDRDSLVNAIDQSVARNNPTTFLNSLVFLVAPEAGPETMVEGAVETVVEPTVEPTVEPIVEAIVEPIVEPIVETTVEPTVEAPTLETTVETVVEPTVEPTVESTAPAVTMELTVEGTVETTVEPAAPAAPSSPAAPIEKKQQKDQREPAAASAAISRLAAMRLDGDLAARLSGTQLRIASREALFVDRDLAAGRLADPLPQADEEPPAVARAAGRMQATDTRAVDRVDLPSVASQKLGRIAGLDELADALGDLIAQHLRPSVRRSPSKSAADVVFAKEAW